MSLQSDLMLYSQFATGSSPAAVDYKELQYAIETQNVSQAEIELARLRQDSEIGNPVSFQINTSQPAVGNATAGANSVTAAETTIDSASGATPPPSGSIINVTA